jgi:hypothetical protein
MKELIIRLEIIFKQATVEAPIDGGFETMIADVSSNMTIPVYRGSKVSILVDLSRKSNGPMYRVV